MEVESDVGANGRPGRDDHISRARDIVAVEFVMATGGGPLVHDLLRGGVDARLSRRGRKRQALYTSTIPQQRALVVRQQSNPTRGESLPSVPDWLRTHQRDRATLCQVQPGSGLVERVNATHVENQGVASIRAERDHAVRDLTVGPAG